MSQETDKLIEALIDGDEDDLVKDVGQSTSLQTAADAIRQALKENRRIASVYEAYSTRIGTTKYIWLRGNFAESVKPPMAPWPDEGLEREVVQIATQAGYGVFVNSTKVTNGEYQLVLHSFGVYEAAEDEGEFRELSKPRSVADIANEVVDLLERRPHRAEAWPEGFPEIKDVEISPLLADEKQHYIGGRINADHWVATRAIDDLLNKLQDSPILMAKPYVTFADPQSVYWRKFAIVVSSTIKESEDEDDLVKDVSGMNEPRKMRPITGIRTKADYEEYEQRVEEFFRKEGINNLSSVSDAEGNTIENEFTWRPCECCHRPLGGSRVKANGYNPQTGEIQEYWICRDCEYYATYGQLDDMTMMDMKDDPPESGPVQERYGGAAQERGIWYHGTSAKLIPKILSQGLITDPKLRAWSQDPDYGTSIIQPTRRSLRGIYVTTRLGTATGSAIKTAQRDKTNEAIVVLELQPRSMVADEDDVTQHIKSIASHLADSAYHHIWLYFMEVYGDKYKDTEDRYYGNVFDKQKLEWVDNAAKRLVYGYTENPPEQPQLFARVKELLFNEGFRVMLQRVISYIKPGSWDMSHWRSEWSKGFGDYDNAPPVPDSKQSEDAWLAFAEKLTHTLKDKARPSKQPDAFRDTGRLLQNVGFSGSNRIICVIERIDAREPEFHSRMLVHYGKPPQKLIDDWSEQIGELKPEDITYVSKLQEASFQHTGGMRFWGTAAAGGLFLAKDTGRLLIPKRSKDVEQPHTWGTWGGALERDEDPAKGAEREMREETGYTGPMELTPIHVFQKGTFLYHNFLATVPNEFQPELNAETEDAVWVRPGDWPSPLHFGLEDVIKHAGHRLTEAEEDSELKDVAHPQPTEIFIKGKRWFDRRYGNSYFSAEIFIDGKLVHTLPAQYGADKQYFHEAWRWLVEKGIVPGIRHMLARDVAKEQGIALDYYAIDVKRFRDLDEALEDEDDLTKELSEPGQQWFFKLKEWPTCKEIRYFVTDNPNYRYSPGCDDFGLEGCPQQAGGHTFPKRSRDDDLRLLAQAQIRVFKKAGRFDPKQWANIWEWLKHARRPAGVPPPPQDMGHPDYDQAMAEWKKKYKQ